jgi:hypothetical protein
MLFLGIEMLTKKKKLSPIKNMAYY